MESQDESWNFMIFFIANLSIKISICIKQNMASNFLLMSDLQV